MNELEQEEWKKEYNLWELEKALSFLCIEDLPYSCNYFITWLDDIREKYNKDKHAMSLLCNALRNLSQDIHERHQSLYRELLNVDVEE